jgi:hypothetical protein
LKSGCSTTCCQLLGTQIETQLQLLTERVQQLEILNVKLQERVAVMTKSNETKHVFQLYKHQTIPNKYLFIRTQSKYLQRAKKAGRYDIILNDVNVPNSMNILNRLKEKLAELHISFEASKNKLRVDANVLNMVRELLDVIIC